MCIYVVYLFGAPSNTPLIEFYLCLTYGSEIDRRYAALWVENPFSHTSARTTYRLGEANFHTGPEEEGIFSRHNVLLSISVYLSCTRVM